MLPAFSEIKIQFSEPIEEVAWFSMAIDLVRHQTEGKNQAGIFLFLSGYAP